MNDFYFVFKQDDLLVCLENDTINVPQNNQLNIDITEKFLFHKDEEGNFYLLEDIDSDLVPTGYSYHNMRELRQYHGQLIHKMASRGYQLYNWRRKHRFCGNCGHTFQAMKADRSLSCSNCGNLLFPQTSNAVITAILKEGKILLGHNKNFPDGLYSLIAGFVEMGESFEEAVHREIYEEVGIRVKNVRYFDNQEWPYPNSTMIGFFADYDSGEITVDGEEILDAGWYTPENFPILPGEVSIARRMIDHYRKSHD